MKLQDKCNPYNISEGQTCQMYSTELQELQLNYPYFWFYHVFNKVYMLSLPKYQVTGTCSGHAKLLLVQNWSKSTNYLIHNIFMNCVTSLIAHELAGQIYLGFIQIGAERIEFQTILRKLTKTRKFCSHLRFRH
jgi:hypothetical protein